MHTQSSFIFLITYTLNSFLMIDLEQLRQAGNFRFIAVVDENLKSVFLPYEAAFDLVYYIPITFSNVFFVESFPEKATLAIESELLINSSIHLISFFEGDVEATAKLRDRFDIPGLSYKQAILFRDKLLMKETLLSQGVLIPKGFYLDFNLPCKSLFESCKTELGLPFIVKPVHLAASVGFKNIQSYNEFHAFYLNHIDTDYMAEEKLDGDLYHLDVVVSQGAVKWFGCSQYNLPTTEFMHHHPIGSMPLLPKENSLISKEEALSPDVLKIYDLHETFKNYASKIPEYFGIQDAILHVEIFKTAEKIYFLEVAARPSGGLVVSVYRKMFGYDIIQASLCYLAAIEYLGEKTEGLSYFWMSFPEKEHAEEHLHKLNIQYEKMFAKTSCKLVQESFGGQQYRVLAYENSYVNLKKKFFSLATV